MRLRDPQPLIMDGINEILLQRRLEVARRKIDRKDKQLHREFVWLAASEYEHLCSLLGKPEAERWIDELNLYLGSKGDPYESHYYTIQVWARRAKAKATLAIQSTPNGKGTAFEAAVLIDHMRTHQTMPTDLPKGIADRFRRMCARLKGTCHAPRNWPEYHQALLAGSILPDWISTAFQDTE